MVASSSTGPGSEPGTPNIVPARSLQLDETDHAIVRALVADARLPNNALAAEVGIAPSTCLLRVRRLRDHGVIRGFHAEIDPAALGLPIQAMIAVRLQVHSRNKIEQFTAAMATAPQMLNVYFLAGPNDYLLHVVADSPEGLRKFVIDLSSNPAVAHTETSLIFEHVRAAGAVPSRRASRY